MWAWIQNNQVRDICHGDPALCYHPDIAKFYDTQVPDGTENGATLVDGEWVNPLPPPPASPPEPPKPTLADFDAALTAHLDSTAQQRRWESRITLAVRAGYPNPWQQEAIAFGTWMDVCNALAYELMAEVQAGTRPLPSTTQALIDELPAMVWPT